MGAVTRIFKITHWCHNLSYSIRSPERAPRCLWCFSAHIDRPTRHSRICRILIIAPLEAISVANLIFKCATVPGARAERAVSRAGPCITWEICFGLGMASEGALVGN